jgi:hypothetical protein
MNLAVYLRARRHSVKTEHIVLVKVDVELVLAMVEWQCGYREECRILVRKLETNGKIRAVIEYGERVHG